MSGGARLAAALLILGAAAAPALADVTVKLQVDGSDRELALSGNSLSYRTADGVTVFRGDPGNEVLLICDPKSRSAVVLTRAEIEKRNLARMESGWVSAPGAGAAAAKALAEARAEAMEEIQKLDPAERDSAMRALDERLPAGTGPSGTGARTYVSLGSTKRIDDVECDGYAIQAGEERIGEIWAAPLSAFGVTAGEFRALPLLWDFLAAGTGAPGEPTDPDLALFDAAAPDFRGIPVLIEITGNGAASTTRLVGVDAGPVDPSLFDYGSDFQKVEPPEAVPSENPEPEGP